jgi:NAD(P)-dependent dehydrogenase (short-subunit alcohol dehydrogenase family)
MKTILITGCSSGFGLEMVGDLLGEGHKVIATMRNASERMDIVKPLLDQYPENLIVKSLDVTSESERAELVKFLGSNEVSGLDVLVNNAGLGYFGALEDMSEAQIREQMEVNFFGSAFLTRDCMPFLRKTKGKVIFISSLMGRYSCPLGAVYSASKYALEGLIEGLKFEMASFGVEVCSIAPGGHRTNFVKSVVWAKEAGNPDSAYFNLSEALKRMMNKLVSRGKAPKANKVSSEVVRLVRKSKMPRRVMVGKDAKSVTLMQRLLPEWLYQLLLNRSFQTFLGRKHAN